MLPATSTPIIFRCVALLCFINSIQQAPSFFPEGKGAALLNLYKLQLFHFNFEYIPTNKELFLLSSSAAAETGGPSTSALEYIQNNKELFLLSLFAAAEDRGFYMLKTFSFSLKNSFSTTSSPGSLYSNDFNFLWKPSLSLMIATLALRTNSINP